MFSWTKYRAGFEFDKVLDHSMRPGDCQWTGRPHCPGGAISAVRCALSYRKDIKRRGPEAALRIPAIGGEWRNVSAVGKEEDPGPRTNKSLHSAVHNATYFCNAISGFVHDINLAIHK